MESWTRMPTFRLSPKRFISHLNPGSYYKFTSNFIKNSNHNIKPHNIVTVHYCSNIIAVVELHIIREQYADVLCCVQYNHNV